VLRALFDSPLAADLTFKDGTSLSKVSTGFQKIWI